MHLGASRVKQRATLSAGMHIKKLSNSSTLSSTRSSTRTSLRINFRVSLNEYAGETQKFMRKQQGDLKREAQKTIVVIIQSKGYQSNVTELKINVNNLKTRMGTKKAVRNRGYEEHMRSLKQQQKDAVKENKCANKDLLNAQKIELQKEVKTKIDGMQNKIHIEVAKTAVKDEITKERQREIDRLIKEKGELDKKYNKRLEIMRKDNTKLLQQCHDLRNNNITRVSGSGRTSRGRGSGMVGGKRVGESADLSEVQARANIRLYEYQAKLDMTANATNTKNAADSKKRTNSVW